MNRTTEQLMIVAALALIPTACQKKSSPQKEEDGSTQRADSNLIGAASGETAPPGSYQSRKTTTAQNVEDSPSRLVQRFSVALKAELQQAMKQGGPATAIDVCSVKAPLLSKQVKSEHFTIRRIGTRVRNPDNAPSPQDNEILRQLTAENPIIEKEGLYYEAIFVQPICLTCHGPSESLPPIVTEALKKKYPDDKAVNYALGELRGAFVVQSRTPTP